MDNKLEGYDQFLDNIEYDQELDVPKWQQVKVQVIIMGCSHHADKDGIFEIAINEYGYDREIGYIRLVGLESYGKVDINIIHGNER